jgi:hypothetical protein
VQPTLYYIYIIAVDDANYNVMHLIIPQTQKAREDEEEADLDDLEQKLKEIEEKVNIDINNNMNMLDELEKKLISINNDDDDNDRYDEMHKLQRLEGF